MYCSNCGAKASGNFCAACGHKLADNPAPVEAPKLAQLPVESGAIAIDWEYEYRCDILLACPEVRDLIARYAGMAKKCMTGEEFMKAADVFYKPMVGISLETVGKLQHAAAVENRSPGIAGAH